MTINQDVRATLDRTTKWDKGFWDMADEPIRWLIKDLFVEGNSHSLFAELGHGKSALVTYLIAALASDPNDDDIICIYLDYEMSIRQVGRRLRKMGYGPESDLDRLKYVTFPTLPMFDTAAGGDALMLLISEYRAMYDKPMRVCIIIDTLSRVISGDDNTTQPFKDFSRHTASRLKAEDITIIRIDHRGKNQKAGTGPVGSHAKGTDVDVAWRMERKGSIVTLIAEKNREDGPSKIVFNSVYNEDEISYKRVDHNERVTLSEAMAEPDGEAVDPVAIKVAELDAMGFSESKSGNKAHEAVGGKRATVLAAQKFRKTR